MHTAMGLILKPLEEMGIWGQVRSFAYRTALGCFASN
jgi:hypothetical protein